MTTTALISLSGCHKKPPIAQAHPTITVTAAVVRVQPAPRTVDASGTVAAWQDIPVGAETGGLTAVVVAVDEGDTVRQGQLLVKMDDSVLRAQLAQQDAAVASARATLAQQQAALARSQGVFQRGFLSRADLDVAVANQQTSQANLASAQALRQETATRLAQTEVRAPVSGVITSRSVLKGQIVAAGSELFRLVRDGQLEMNANVPEADLPLVRAGQTATVIGDQGQSATGRVRLVTPRVDPQTRLGVARITLPAGSGLRSGNYGRAQIAVGVAPAVMAPQSAVTFREGQPGVYVIDAGNRVHFSPIQTGIRLGDLVEVRSGLAGGQRIASDGAGFLGDDDLVRVASTTGG